MRYLSIAGVFLVALAVARPVPALAHAFPDHAEPKVGATLAGPPTRVSIWFDGALEPAFSTLTVKDAGGRVVDNKDGRVNPSNPNLLEVTTRGLSSGSYRVFWTVVARDGHRTTGDYGFTIK